jgi:subtilisin family serine protease
MRFLLRVGDFPQRTGKGVRVAVIDSGVHATHPHVQGVAGGVAITDAGIEHDDFIDRLGHGTAVTAVIREKAPTADIFAIKVFDRDLSTTGGALVVALQWARRHEARLVNLSLGTTNATHEPLLRRELDAANEAGVVIVAAGAESEKRWLPGSLAGVVSVTLDMALPREVCELTVEANGAVTASACGYPRPIPGVAPARNLMGLSFAVANVSGLIARALEGVPQNTSIGAALVAAVNSASPSR